MKQIIFFILVFFSTTMQAQKFELKTGDLIFQESTIGQMNNGIKEVTKSIDGYKFTHVGIVWIHKDGNQFVIEATHPKVTITPLKAFLCPVKEKNCPPKSVVGRLLPAYQKLIPRAIIEAKKMKGKAYDDAFDLNNDKYYCSELIYDIFLKANDGKPVFELEPMTFKQAGSNEYATSWVNYFQKLNIPIPEGQLGLNPGGISRSKKLKIVHVF